MFGPCRGLEILPEGWEVVRKRNEHNATGTNTSKEGIEEYINIFLNMAIHYLHNAVDNKQFKTGRTENLSLKS